MENQFRVIVAGGRDFQNYHLLEEKLNKLLSEKKNVIIVSSLEDGTGRLGHRYDQNNNLKVDYYPALYQVFGNMAAFERNQEMAKNADACICFWNGKSVGTKDMMDIAKTMNIPLRVISY